MNDQRIDEFLGVAEKMAEVFAAQEYEDEIGVEYMVIAPEIDADLAKAFVRRFRAFKKVFDE